MDSPRKVRLFSRFARQAAALAGRPVTFFCAVGIVLTWAIVGPYFQFSDTWQLVINTGTTIVTFLIVFLIQNTQNRDTEAVHLKLDEIIRSLEGARNEVLDLEELSEAELDHVRAEYFELAERAHKALAARRLPTDAVDDANDHSDRRPRKDLTNEDNPYPSGKRH